MMISSNTIVALEAKKDLLCVDSFLERVLAFLKNFMRIYKNPSLFGIVLLGRRAVPVAAPWPLLILLPATTTPHNTHTGCPFPFLVLTNICSSIKTLFSYPH